MKKSMSHYGETVRERRKALGLTQKQLGDESGVSFSLIAKLEPGIRSNPTKRIVDKLEAALGRLEQARAGASESGKGAAA